MMKTQVFLIGIGFICTMSATAQNDIDALRYSQLTFGGTARFVSMAGSMGALGGDFSTLSFNPAGIGVFRKSELSISPSFLSQTASSTYNETNSMDKRINLNLGNIGWVATFGLNKNNNNNNNTGWQSLNFGFGYNRTNSFQYNTSIKGYNTTSSLLDTYVGAANGYTSADFDNFSTNLAWKTYLINPNAAPDTLHYNHVIPHYGELQTKSTQASGSMGETDISFGGNYNNKVYVGASLGIVNVKYNEQSVYTESDEKDTISNFKSFQYTQNLTTRGTGVNFKFGMIVKANDWLRFGAAIHSPTVIHLSDAYNSDMKSDLENGITYSAKSPDGSFNYTITTPFRAIGSVGFIVHKNALLNAEYEYVDYSNMRLYSHPDVFSDVNNTINTKYRATGNLRIGGEIRFDPLTFRAGYALYGSPFASGINENANRTSYTAGIGFRENNYFIDFAYVFTKYTMYDYLYDPALVNAVKNDYHSSTFMVTLGVRF